MIENSDALGIAWKDRSHNKMEFFLENIAIKQNDVIFICLSKLELQTRPSFLVNVQNWQVFEDDRDILKFLNCEDQFCGQEIDYAAFVKTIDGKDAVFSNEFVQLKTNKIPKGLVVLETIFDSQD